MAGRSLRSLRVGGALSAMAAGHGFIATARRGSGIVQLWHAETGAPAHQIVAHADGMSIRFLAFRGRSVLVSTSTDKTAALHSVREGLSNRSAIPSNADAEAGGDDDVSHDEAGDVNGADSSASTTMVLNRARLKPL